MPLPASTTTVRRPDAGEVDEACAGTPRSRPARRARRSVPGRAVVRGHASSSISRRISASPVSWPTGEAPARHSLMPLYWAGLWLAVNIAPGQSRRAAREVERVGADQADADDVRALRRRTSAKASTSVGEDGPHVVTDDDPPPGRPERTATKAAPTSRARVRVELVGDDATDVVRLDDLAQVAHGGELSQPPESAGRPSGDLAGLVEHPVDGQRLAVQVEPAAVLAAVAGQRSGRGCRR